MRGITLVLLLALGVPDLPAQLVNPTHRDPQGIALLSAAVGAAGGSRALTSIQDYNATGTITYYWSTQQTGNATLKGRGPNQFRLDAQLPSGTRSWAVSNGSGALRQPDGTLTPIPFHNAVTLGSIAFPLLRVLSAVADTSTDVIDSGVVAVQGQQFRSIRIHRNILPQVADPDGSANRLQTASFFFDPVTFQLVGYQDQTHPVETMTKDVPHSVYFSDFRRVNGVLMPFSITEYIGGQKTWSLQLSAVTFNLGLTDTDFQLQ